MSFREPSRTAHGVALLRAAHRVLDQPPWLLDDPVAERLLEARVRKWLDGRPAELESGPARALRSHVLVRSRLAEDQLREAVAEGVRQYVVLGAGLDTFAYRLPDWAEPIRIFEVDHQASQIDKQARLRDAGVAVPSSLTFVSVDFERSSLEAQLIAAGVDLAAPIVVAWLGVTMYLDAASNDAVFAFAGRLAPGSQLVFTFAPEAGEDAESQGGARLAALAAQVGEPWRTFYRTSDLDARLRAHGFATVWIPTPDELATRYFVGRSDGLPAPRRSTLVVASTNPPFAGRKNRPSPSSFPYN